MPADKSILGLQIKTETVGQAEIDKLTTSYNKFADAITKQSARMEQQNTSNAASFAKLQTAIQDPLSAVTKSVTDATLGYGKFGLAVAGTSAAIAAGSAFLVKFAADQAAAAEQTVNFASRLGISIGETERLSAMAKAAGIDISFMQNASARLAVALEDQSEAGTKARKTLADLGVTTQIDATHQRELGQITLDMMRRLSQQEDGTKRLAQATALLGKQANELTPLLKQFEAGEAAMKKFGVGVDENGTRKLVEFDGALDDLGTTWDEFKKTFATFVTPVIKPLVDFTTSALNVGSPGNRNNNNGLGGGPSAAKVAADQARLDAAQKEEAKKQFDATEAHNKLLAAQNKELERTKQITQEITKLQEKANADAQIRSLGKDAVPALQELIRQNSRNDLTDSDKMRIGDILTPEIVAQQGEAEKKGQEMIAKLSRDYQAQVILGQQQGIGLNTAQRIGNVGSGVRTGEEADAQRIIAQIRTDAAKRIFDLEQQRIELEHAGDDDKLQFLNEMADLAKARADKDKEIGDAEADRDAKILAIERERTDLAKQRARDLGVAQLADQGQRIQGNADRQIRSLQASARPGQEISTASKVEQLRQDAAQKVFEIEIQRLDVATRDMDAEQQQATRDVENIKLISDLEKSRQEASLEYWDTVLSLQRAQEQQSRDAAGRTFDAITASGKDAFAQLGQTALKTFERQVFVNITSVAYDQARKAASTAIPGQIDPKTGNLTTLGKVFQGTPLGVDPLKQATIDQTRATRDLTNEMRKRNNGSSSGSGIPTLLDRPLLRTPGTFEDGLKDSKALKDAKDKEAAAQDAGTAAIKSLTGKLIGLGSTAAIGAVGAIGGIQQGGVQGAVSAAGSVASATGAILGQLSGALGKYGGLIGSVAGIGLGLVSQFLPNAKATFDSEQDATIKKNAYVAPAAQSQNVDATGGGNLGTNLRGAPNVTVQFNVSTIDTKGVKSFFDAHGATIAEVVGKATQGGQSPNMTLAINKTAFPGAS